MLIFLLQETKLWLLQNKKNLIDGIPWLLWCDCLKQSLKLIYSWKTSLRNTSVDLQYFHVVLMSKYSAALRFGIATANDPLHSNWSHSNAVYAIATQMEPDRWKIRDLSSLFFS